jgi:hypothetical protein
MSPHLKPGKGCLETRLDMSPHLKPVKGCLETRLDMSPHLKPGNTNQHVWKSPSRRPCMTNTGHIWACKVIFHNYY